MSEDPLTATPSFPGSFVGHRLHVVDSPTLGSDYKVGMRDGEF